MRNPDNQVLPFHCSGGFIDPLYNPFHRRSESLEGSRRCNAHPAGMPNRAEVPREESVHAYAVVACSLQQPVTSG